MNSCYNIASYNHKLSVQQEVLNQSLAKYVKFYLPDANSKHSTISSRLCHAAPLLNCTDKNTLAINKSTSQNYVTKSS